MADRQILRAREVSLLEAGGYSCLGLGGLGYFLTPWTGLTLSGVEKTHGISQSRKTPKKKTLLLFLRA